MWLEAALPINLSTVITFKSTLFWCYSQGIFIRLTDTRASVTLVRTAGRREWTRILCSVTASTSRVAAFFGPRFNSNVERLPPLKHKNHKEPFRLKQQPPRHLLMGISYFYRGLLYLKGSGEDTGWLSNRLSCGDSCGGREERINASSHGFSFSPVRFYISNSPALRCEASGWRGMEQFAWSERYACEENVTN